VFAVSCKTGELELVGVYHAGYTGGSALNVVVDVDQLKDLMFTLKRRARPKSDAAALDAQSRAELYALASQTPEPFFPFGAQSALVRPRPDGGLFFALMPKAFPLQTTPLVVIEDLPPEGPTEFGVIGRVWFGSAQGLKGYARSALDSDAQAQLQHVLDGMRHDALAAFHYGTAARSGDVSRQKFEEMSRRERSVRKAMGARGELDQAMSELAARLAPRSVEPGLRLAEVYAATPTLALPASTQPGRRIAATRDARSPPDPGGPVSANPKRPAPVPAPP
jgi:serine protease Do